MWVSRNTSLKGSSQEARRRRRRRRRYQQKLEQKQDNTARGKKGPNCHTFSVSYHQQLLKDAPHGLNRRSRVHADETHGSHVNHLLLLHSKCFFDNTGNWFGFRRSDAAWAFNFLLRVIITASSTIFTTTITDCDSWVVVDMCTAACCCALLPLPPTPSLPPVL